MKMPLKQFLPQRWWQWTFLAGLLAVTTQNFGGWGENYIGLIEEVGRIRALNKLLSHQKIGYQFAGLEEVTRGLDYIGYYTDENIDINDQAHKLFAHAQYILAPTILDFGNTEHNFILLVCTNEKNALRKIKELNAIPIRANKFGMILARRIK